MTRKFSFALSILTGVAVVGFLLIAALSPASASTPGYEAEQTDVKFVVDEDTNRSVQVTFDWSWELFDKDASKYDHNLATAALCLSNAAEHSQDDVEDMLHVLGFETYSDSSVGYSGFNWHNPAVTFGLKVVEGNGKKTNIVVVVVRGTENVADVLTDAGSLFDSFGVAAYNTENKLCDFILAHDNDFAPDSEADWKFFITGHSLGGATAGYTARMLADSYGEDSIPSTFVYTFASPNNATSDEAAEDWGNIHNIINTNDVVPTVPPNYTRAGDELTYDATSGRYDNAIWAVYMDENGYTETGLGLLDWLGAPEDWGYHHACATYLACMLVGVPENLGTSAENHTGIAGETISESELRDGEQIDALGTITPDTKIHVLSADGEPLQNACVVVKDYCVGAAKIELGDDATFSLSDLGTLGEYGLKATIAVRVNGQTGVYRFSVEAREGVQPDSLDVVTNFKSGNYVDREVFLALDTSGSMDGDPLVEARQASCGFVSTVFDYGANVGIIQFDDQAEVTLEPAWDGLRLLHAISALEADGGTNIGDALQVAYDELAQSDASRRIVVLMSDGHPEDGLMGDELVAKAAELKDSGILIYALGFYHDMDDAEKAEAYSLMQSIASPGCSYDVSNADDLVYFFGDVGGQISGEHYLYVRVACPVDVSVTLGDETLDSSAADGTQRASFGSLAFESIEGEDEPAKVLRLREGEPYEIEICGTGEGSMDYTIGFMDEDGFYSDMRTFDGIDVMDGTRVATTAEVADVTSMQVDYDGDGQIDRYLKAGAGETAQELDPHWYEPVVVRGIAAAAGVVVLIALLVWLGMQKRRIGKRREAEG